MEVFHRLILDPTMWKAISKDITRFQDNVYLVKVNGDSMIGAGINDGDIVLVKESKEFKNGDIVLARTSDDTTIKRFIQEKDEVYLKPENPAYPNIYSTGDEIKMLGIVISNLKQ